jgi:HSP20 family protein
MFRTNLFGRPSRSGSLFDDLENDFAEMRREFDRLLLDVSDGGGQAHVWGYQMEIGPDGVPRVRTFGNASSAPAALAEGWREPFTTQVVDPKKGVVRVTAEMPGVSKDAIHVETLTDRVVIEATGQPYSYWKEVLCPGVELDPDSAKAEYNNGILEVTAKLAKASRPRGKAVKVK